MANHIKQEERKKRRERRNLLINKMIEAAEGVKNLNIDTSGPVSREKFIQNFSIIWGVLSPAIELVEQSRWTGNKLDKVLAELLEVGGRIAFGAGSEDDHTAFIKKLDRVWKWVNRAIELAADALGLANSIKPIAGHDKIVSVLDQIHDIGIWILGAPDEEPVD